MSLRASSRLPAPDATAGRLSRLPGIRIPGPPEEPRSTKLDAGGVQAVRVDIAAVARRPACPLSSRRRLCLWSHPRSIAISSGGWRPPHPRVSCASTTGSPPSILFPRRWTMRSPPIAGSWQRAPARNRPALVGDSAGGGLVFALLLRLRDEGVPLPAAAVGVLAVDRSRNERPVVPRQRRQADPMLRTERCGELCPLLSRRGRPAKPVCVSALRRSGRVAAIVYSGRRGRDPHDDAVGMADKLRAASFASRSRSGPGCRMSGRCFARVLAGGTPGGRPDRHFLQREMARVS